VHSAQDCINYVLHFQSDVSNGGPSAVYYNVSESNVSIGSGSALFDLNHSESWDTLCMTAGCNLALTIDPSTFPIGNSFSFEILLEGQPLQMLTYEDWNGYYSVTFCSTIGCPSQIQSQTIDCDTYDFFVPAYVGNVSWDFGDTSNDPIGNYQQHTYAQDGLYDVVAMIDAAGCGPQYTLAFPITVDCATTPICPTQLILDTLTCQEYYIHFDTSAPGSVDWEVDGFAFSTPTAEMTQFFPNGLHTIIAFYHPTGLEGCSMGGCSTCSITFYDTVTVACEVCEPVFMGFTSVPDLGGTEMLNYTITNDVGAVVNSGQVNFTANQPVFDFFDCWLPGCYYLDICSEGAVADSNFIVDVIAPLTIISNEQYTTGVCNGRLLQLGFNNDCQNSPSDTCSGAWLSWNTMASYLTMPPAFDLDTLVWSVIDQWGNTLADGVQGISEDFPEWSDSLCLSSPLSCYQLQMDLVDNITGLTYLDVTCNADTIVHSGIMNVVQNSFEANFQFEQGLNCFGNSVVNQAESKISLYPNPVNNLLSIQYSGDLIYRSVIIYNIHGEEVIREALNSGLQMNLNVEYLNSGIYILAIGNQHVRFTKI
jgi:hypothetical protein